MNPLLTISLPWQEAFPGAHIGILVLRSVENPAGCPDLDSAKAELEAQLRQQYAALERQELLKLPVLQAYDAYYKPFNKTYHVQLQLESLVHKGKGLPRVAALVEAMFMAELKNQLLTAGHDLAAVQPPITLDIARGGETYTLLRGTPQTVKTGDMFIRDQQGILSCILYGPDQRTPITPATHQALFTVYAPTGITPQAVQAHLADIETYVRLISPQAETVEIGVYP